MKFTTTINMQNWHFAARNR